MEKPTTVHRVTKILVDIMFYGGIAVCIALPFVLPAVMRFFEHPPEMRIPYTIILLASGIPAVYIVYQLKQIFKTLLGGNPFVYRNISCLRKSAVVCALIALVYLVRITFWFTVGSLVVVVIFALLCLFALTLKDVFKQAVAYKEETDWTV